MALGRVFGEEIMERCRCGPNPEADIPAKPVSRHGPKVKSKSKPPPQPPLILPPQSLPASGARLPALTLGVDEFGLAGSEQASATYGAVGFLPTSIPRDLATPFAAPTSPGQPPQPTPRTQYGLLSAARDTVLGLPEARVDDIAKHFLHLLDSEFLRQLISYSVL